MAGDGFTKVTSKRHVMDWRCGCWSEDRPKDDPWYVWQKTNVAPNVGDMPKKGLFRWKDSKEFKDKAKPTTSISAAGSDKYTQLKGLKAQYVARPRRKMLMANLQRRRLAEEIYSSSWTATSRRPVRSSNRVCAKGGANNDSQSSRRCGTIA